MRVTALRRLSRDQLYAEVWRRPIGQIARDWAVTSAALRSACKALGVPVPPVGHWAAVRAGTARPPSALPASNEATTITVEAKPRESLVEWMKRDDPPAAHKAARTALAHPKLAGSTPPRLVPVTAWAATVFGEHAPHPNTLRRWVHDGRFYPPAKKIGRTWWVTPDAEYVGD